MKAKANAMSPTWVTTGEWEIHLKFEKRSGCFHALHMGVYSLGFIKSILAPCYPPACPTPLRAPLAHPHAPGTYRFLKVRYLFK